MSPDRFKITPAVYLILQRRNQILLMLRANTNYMDGWWGLPSGHKEEGETPREAIIREAFEELGLVYQSHELFQVHTLFRNSLDSERVEFFFRGPLMNGLTNAEPHKCTEIAWFDLKALPENTIPYIKFVLSRQNMGIKYSEYDEKVGLETY